MNRCSLVRQKKLKLIKAEKPKSGHFGITENSEKSYQTYSIFAPRLFEINNEVDQERDFRRQAEEKQSGTKMYKQKTVG